MRITRSSLYNLARDTAAIRFRQDHDLVCIYLTGSMLLENPLLGGTTDIDLIFVHAKEPSLSREIQKLSDEVTLDIAHLPQTVFQQPRHLRMDPWIGSYLCENPIILQENQHWFEFTQASVSAHFYAPETILARVKPLAEKARKSWLNLHSKDHDNRPSDIFDYLKAVEWAVNSVVCLYGSPLTERRFLMDFPTLAQKVNHPDLAHLVNSLVMNSPLQEGFWNTWLPIWKETLVQAGKNENCPAKLLPARQLYYTKACEILQDDNPAAALWIMARTWSLASCALPASKKWSAFCEQIGLDSSGFKERLITLDNFLDLIDETIEKWSQSNGI